MIPLDTRAPSDEEMYAITLNNTQVRHRAVRDQLRTMLSDLGHSGG